MNKINLINLEWNCYNGFILNILYIDMYAPFNIDGSLFGVNYSKHFLYIDLFWINFKIFYNQK